MEPRCQGPHPKLPGRSCNTLQHVELEGDWGEGILYVECRHCEGMIKFHFSGTEGTDSAPSVVVASSESHGVAVKEISSARSVT